MVMGANYAKSSIDQNLEDGVVQLSNAAINLTYDQNPHNRGNHYQL